MMNVLNFAKAIAFLLFVGFASFHGSAPIHQTFSSYFYNNNWAGYIIAPYVYSIYNQVHFISGTFNVPVIMHSSVSSEEDTAVWIGIDGYNKNSTNTHLIQTGIQGVNINGTVTYSAWYELIPAPETPINMKIKPNDIISAQISLINQNSSIWNIYLKDLTSNQIFSQNVSYSTQMQTAEWIVESPTSLFPNGTMSIDTLAPFSQVQFSNAYLEVVGKTHDDFTAIGQKYRPKTPILINNTGTVETYTSPINSDNLSFSVSYLDPPATTSTISTTSSISTSIPTTIATTAPTTLPTTTVPACPNFYYYNSTGCTPQTISPACPPNYPNSPTYYTCSGTTVNPAVCPSGYSFNSSRSQCILLSYAGTTITTTRITTTIQQTQQNNSTDIISAIINAILNFFRLL